LARLTGAETRPDKRGWIMRRALRTAFLLLLAAACLLHWRLAAETAALRQDTALLQLRLVCQQRDTEALRQQLDGAAAASGKARATNETQAASLRTRQTLEHEVEQVRGLKFLQPVVYRSMKSAEFRHFLVKKIREEYTPGEIRDYARSLAMVGLVPEGVDFEACVTQVMDEQVAAFYDQDKAELYTFTDSPLTGNLSRMILAHEMTHALQDQHFHIGRWPLKCKDNDDMVSAHMAVLEGDATVAMQNVYKRSMQWKTALTDFQNAMAQDKDKLTRAPRYFRDTLMFSYQEGSAFIEELRRVGGQPLVDRAFQKPPTTTAQILHPEKFHAAREEPVPSEPEATPPPGWRRLTANAVGEFGVIVLLRQFGHEADAAAVARGWRGDRFRTFEAADGDGWLYWRSVWTSEAAARRFANAYRDVITSKNARRQPLLTLELKQNGPRVDVALRVPPATGGTEAARKP
jgi:hypothetical protein